MSVKPEEGHNLPPVEFEAAYYRHDPKAIAA
jgi:hypothetical protein